MTWKQSLSVDVVSLDREHEGLATALEDLFARMRQGMDREAFLAGIDGIIAAVAAHFAHEERVMRNISLPSYGAHCQLHRALLDEIRDFRADVAEDLNGRTIEALEHFLQFWLFKHITSEDHKILEHLNRS